MKILIVKSGLASVLPHIDLFFFWSVIILIDFPSFPYVSFLFLCHFDRSKLEAELDSSKLEAAANGAYPLMCHLQASKEFNSIAHSGEPSGNSPCFTWLH